MRNVIVIGLVLGLGMIAYGKEPERAPAQFENSQIERKLEDGTTQTFDGDKFMIVPKVKKKKVAKPVVVEKTPEPVIITKTETVVKPMRNTLFIVGGIGPVGLRKASPPYVDLQYDGVMGLGYKVMLDERYSLLFMGLSNKTALGGLGWDFP